MKFELKNAAEKSLFLLLCLLPFLLGCTNPNSTASYDQKTKVKSWVEELGEDNPPLVKMVKDAYEDDNLTIGEYAQIKTKYFELKKDYQEEEYSKWVNNLEYDPSLEELDSQRTKVASKIALVKNDKVILESKLERLQKQLDDLDKQISFKNGNIPDEGLVQENTITDEEQDYSMESKTPFKQVSDIIETPIDLR